MSAKIECVRFTPPYPEHILKLMPEPERKRLGAAGITFEEAQGDRQDRSERELQRLIESYLRQRGVCVIRQRMDRKSNVVAGAPDILFSWQGFSIALECKTSDGKQTPEQIAAQVAMEQDGWKYFVVRFGQSATQ